MNMDDKKIDELINKALQEEQALPEGLSRRLEKQIDTWASTEEKKTLTPIRKMPPPLPKRLYSYSRRTSTKASARWITPGRR